MATPSTCAHHLVADAPQVLWYSNEIFCFIFFHAYARRTKQACFFGKNILYRNVVLIVASLLSHSQALIYLSVAFEGDISPFKERMIMKKTLEMQKALNADRK